LFDELDDAQALHIVLKAAVPAHEAIQHFLAAMAERRMAEIVGEGDRLGEIFIQPQRASDGAADQSDLDGVGEARAQVVAGAIEKNLCLVFEPAKGP
jgi:hypothetical protein